MRSWVHSYFSHQWADINGDGRVDLVGVFTPFLPNRDPDPATGQYDFFGFQAHTVTDLLVHLQRPPGCELWEDWSEASATVEGDQLLVQARIRNRSPALAENVTVRILSLPLSADFISVMPRTPEEYEDWAQAARGFYTRGRWQIDGTELVAMAIGDLGPGQQVDVSAQLTVCRANDPPIAALFIVPETDSSQALLYRDEDIPF